MWNFQGISAPFGEVFETKKKPPIACDGGCCVAFGRKSYTPAPPDERLITVLAIVILPSGVLVKACRVRPMPSRWRSIICSGVTERWLKPYTFCAYGPRFDG